jgi:hypothetical protein
LGFFDGGVQFASGGNYSAGGGTTQLQSAGFHNVNGSNTDRLTSNNLSGTWKIMGAPNPVGNGASISLICRVS